MITTIDLPTVSIRPNTTWEITLPPSILAGTALDQISITDAGLYIEASSPALLLIQREPGPRRRSMVASFCMPPARPSTSRPANSPSTPAATTKASCTKASATSSSPPSPAAPTSAWSCWATTSFPAITLGAITYVAIGMDPPAAIDMLRRALIHVVAQHHSLATIPAPAAILPSNGHTAPSNTPDPSDPSPIPPLRVPKDLPKTTMRNKPGPKPGTRRRKVDVEAEMEF